MSFDFEMELGSESAKTWSLNPFSLSLALFFFELIDKK